VDALQTPNGALGGEVDLADGLRLVAEELDAVGAILGGREDIDKAAAAGDGARSIGEGFDLVTGRLEASDELPGIESTTDGEVDAGSAKVGAGAALCEGGPGGDDQGASGAAQGGEGAGPFDGREDVGARELVGEALALWEARERNIFEVEEELFVEREGAGGRGHDEQDRAAATRGDGGGDGRLGVLGHAQARPLRRSGDVRFDGVGEGGREADEFAWHKHLEARSRKSGQATGSV
jgi:hypothetical protein